MRGRRGGTVLAVAGADTGDLDAAGAALPGREYGCSVLGGPRSWQNRGVAVGSSSVRSDPVFCGPADRYQATGDTALLDWAGTLAADVAGRALYTPHGITWSNTEHTRTPPQLPPEPGFMQGAAGIAGWLARLHALYARPAIPPVPARPGPAWL
jgi:hypothetical protein